ncbi:glutathione S-transferase [Rhizobium paknamense]|uniref:Glutathione S-transferase n=1 Tax=Rhizobium paknamense TaxID=1206817 RepID=A0ABU0IA15_9HYPH|nr:glutathione S-transferase family protein [Rhizobium paknamense]MDQ0454116.1 glutathione S-transferase [Rhizobium paknamense]
MKLLYSPASPYSAKVRMAASHLGLTIEAIKVDTTANPAELIAANPLGKIPALVTDAGQGIFDSRSIMHYFDRLSGGKLYPKKDEKRTEAELLEALCDGIADSLVAIMYEKRFRPPEKVHQPWIDRQWEKVTRGLDHLEAHMPKTGKKLHGGHFAMAGMMGYLMLRFPGEWENGHVALAEWPSLFAKKFENYQLLRPQA